MLILVAFQALLLLLLLSFSINATKIFLTVNTYYSEYFADVDVGTPPQTQTLAMDTGSELLWVHCKPCDPQCYPGFDPKNSTSFSDVHCNDTNCDQLEEHSRGCDHKTSTCTYGNKGTDFSMATENVTIGDISVTNMTIGCAHKVNTEDQEGGVLGLSGGPLSVVTRSGGMFRYCLGDSTYPGWLEFGRSIKAKYNISWTTLIYNPKHPSFYYIDGLVGLSVGGEVLDISKDTFQYNPKTGKGGVVLDTGRAATWLPGVAYKALRDKFKEKMGNNYPTVQGFSIFDTCYDLKLGVDDLKNVQVPTITFNFLNYKEFDLHNITLTDARNVLVNRGGNTYYCLAFAPKSDKISYSIIGNVQQKGIPITIDAQNGFVGFGSSPC